MSTAGVEYLSIPAALTGKSMEGMAERLAALSGSGSMLCLVSDGTEPGTFCSGYAPEEGLGDGASAPPRDDLRAFADLLATLRAWPQLVMSVVDGRCMGGGIAFVGLSDWVIASDASRFSLPELWRGLFPAMVFPCLTDRLSPQRARSLAFLASAIDLQQALAWGLVDEGCAAPALAHTQSARLRKFSRLQRDAVAAFKAFSAALEGAPTFSESVRAGAGAVQERLRDETVRARFALTLAERGD